MIHIFSIQILLIVVLIAVAIFAIYKILSKRSKVKYIASWRATVADKKHIERRDSGNGKVEEYYSIIFKMADGTLIRQGVSKEVFDSFNIGDQAEKKNISDIPAKV